MRLICDAIADGMAYKHAASLAGISHETLCQWQRQFPEFSEAMQAAVARGIHARLVLIRVAAEKGDVKAACWYLEHVHPEQFAKSRIEVAHQGSIEHQFAIPAALLDEIARARTEYDQTSRN
jgi:hypothetical protein